MPGQQQGPDYKVGGSCPPTPHAPPPPYLGGAMARLGSWGLLCFAVLALPGPPGAGAQGKWMWFGGGGTLQLRL